ncbi:uncharacterized protein LOC143460862 [Clavelina lepadiformis]|uniref:Proline-rich nuclear receptor coactivator 2 n=1 Tax=Clavelina lepadiformis TaxID=159417 RepID=A0ABP0FQT4_CLALP
MLKVDRHHFHPITAEYEFPASSYHYYKKSRNGACGERPNFQTSRKTPSPNGDVKTYLQRSPTSTVVGSLNIGTTGHSPVNRHMANRMSLKRKVSFKIPHSPTFKDEPASDFKPNQHPLLELKVNEAYAGARFHNPPAADSLPKPPTHWVNATCSSALGQMCSVAQLDNITLHVKGLLNVQA